MSGIETIKAIVEAEKAAAKMLAEAQAKAVEIRKRSESLIEQQREEAIKEARKQATAMIENAQNEAKIEAQVVQKDIQNKMREAISRASARKNRAVEKLVGIVTEMNT